VLLGVVEKNGSRLLQQAPSSGAITQRSGGSRNRVINNQLSVLRVPDYRCGDQHIPASSGARARPGPAPPLSRREPEEIREMRPTFGVGWLDHGHTLRRVSGQVGLHRGTKHRGSISVDLGQVAPIEFKLLSGRRTQNVSEDRRDLAPAEDAPETAALRFGVLSVHAALHCAQAQALGRQATWGPELPELGRSRTAVRRRRLVHVVRSTDHLARSPVGSV